MQSRQTLVYLLAFSLLSTSCYYVKAAIQACNSGAVPCGIGMNPCHNPSVDPCNGEAGHQCWYEACGDDNSTLCNISCRRDDMATITGTIEVPVDSIDTSSCGNAVSGNNDGFVIIPGVYQAPSIEDLTAGNLVRVDMLPSNISSNTSSSSICSDGSRPVNCLYDPCAATTCLVGTTCVPNYCGGCNAQCVLQCPDGSHPVNCLVDPCQTARCGSGLQCVSDFCGGCNAKCVAPSAVEKGDSTGGSTPPVVTTGPNIATEAELCPADKQRVDCNFNPCDGIMCNDGQVCKPTFCGTCGHTCEAQEEPPTANEACPYNPCSRVRCEASFYKTVCQRDTNSCNYRCMALPPPPCEPGSAYSVTQRRCMPCKVGRVASAGSNVCAACGVDYYASSDRTTCLACPPGYSTNGQVGQTRCSKVQMTEG